MRSIDTIAATMASDLVIVVELAGPDGRPVPVQEVFAQVVDLLALADDGGEVTWELVGASTNSPLTVTLAPRPTPSGVVPLEVAERQVRQLRRNLQAVSRGELPSVWRGEAKRRTLQKVLARTAAGTGRVDVATDEQAAASEPSTALTTASAVNALRQLEKGVVVDVPDARSGVQFGSIVGRLIQVTTYYNHPAIQVREELTNELVHCVVGEEDRRRISEVAGFDDVWKGRRVCVRGAIHYNSAGEITRVNADAIELFTEEHVPDAAIQSPAITGGLASEDYVERLRGEGE